MKTHALNLINSFSLMSIGLWGLYVSNAPTSLIPVAFGLFLFLCSDGIKNENKKIAHIAVLLTVVIIAALYFMPLSKELALEASQQDSNKIYRLLAMIGTSVLAMLGFIKSFIEARKNK